MLRCSSATTALAITTVDVSTGRLSPIKYAILPTSLQQFESYFSEPQAIQFPTEDGEVAHAFYYPPNNPDWQAPCLEKPPLIVKSHGGPTAAANSGLDLSLQFWTSRGFAVLDVNYRGSTGYGRKYREKLYGQWGIVDVADCIAGAKFLAACGEVDRNRLVVTGGSAGGYTTLCGLTFHTVFAAGASYYGISDLVALATETHKFELHYIDWLIGVSSEGHAVMSVKVRRSQKTQAPKQGRRCGAKARRPGYQRRHDANDSVSTGETLDARQAKSCRRDTSYNREWEMEG